MPGQRTYRQQLASILEPGHDGEFVAVEPDSGEYFLGNLFYLTRVGRETAHTVKNIF